MGLWFPIVVLRRHTRIRMPCDFAQGSRFCGPRHKRDANNAPFPPLVGAGAFRLPIFHLARLAAFYSPIHRGYFGPCVILRRRLQLHCVLTRIFKRISSRMVISPPGHTYWHHPRRRAVPAHYDMFEWNVYRRKVEAAASTLDEQPDPGKFMVGVLIAGRDSIKDYFASDDFCWMRAPGVRRHICSSACDTL